MFTLTSPSFDNGDRIPAENIRDAGNLSPQLDWTDPPKGTRSFVLTMEDPDAQAPAFRHWMVYNIPPTRRHLAAGRSSSARTEDLPHAYNDFGDLAYDGPQPPAGDPPHSYRFRLAALSVPKLEMGEQPYAGDVWARAYVLGEAELIGTYAREA
ncbi:MAG TPA: YbhB/YbcL family Raf kinase inhibitor-like protein [Pseudolabrys sp.]|nr:YbhB/YbcL family Raf kinase inhibitor-like protein [Pseudolabrys sp.]